MTSTRELAPQQTWALRDPRHDGWRYLTVESVDGPVVVARNRRGRKTTWRSGRFGRGAKFSFVGHDGPGLLPAYSTKPVSTGCLSCPPRPPTLPLTYSLAQGFGCTTVYRDGQSVWATTSDRTRKVLGHVELWARDTPGDWRITLSGAMSEQTYQRHGRDEWVLVRIGYGFA